MHRTNLLEQATWQQIDPIHIRSGLGELNYLLLPAFTKYPSNILFNSNFFLTLSLCLFLTSVFSCLQFGQRIDQLSSQHAHRHSNSARSSLSVSFTLSLTNFEIPAYCLMFSPRGLFRARVSISHSDAGYYWEPHIGKNFS